PGGLGWTDQWGGGGARRLAADSRSWHRRLVWVRGRDHYLRGHHARVEQPVAGRPERSTRDVVPGGWGDTGDGRAGAAGNRPGRDGPDPGAGGGGPPPGRAAGVVDRHPHRPLGGSRPAPPTGRAIAAVE